MVSINRAFQMASVDKSYPASQGVLCIWLDNSCVCIYITQICVPDVDQCLLIITPTKQILMSMNRQLLVRVRPWNNVRHWTTSYVLMSSWVIWFYKRLYDFWLHKCIFVDWRQQTLLFCCGLQRLKQCVFYEIQYRVFSLSQYSLHDDVINLKHFPRYWHYCAGNPPATSQRPF